MQKEYKVDPVFIYLSTPYYGCDGVLSVRKSLILQGLSVSGGHARYDFKIFVLMFNINS